MVWAIAALLLVAFGLWTFGSVREEVPTAVAERPPEAPGHAVETDIESRHAAPAPPEPGASRAEGGAAPREDLASAGGPVGNGAAADADGPGPGAGSVRELADTSPGPRAVSGEEEERRLRSVFRADQARVLLQEVRDALFDCIPPDYPDLEEAGQFVVPLRVEGPGPGQAADQVFVEERGDITFAAVELACMEELLAPARFPPPVASDGETLDGRSYYRLRVPLELP